jgi:hypothetical protein
MIVHHTKAMARSIRIESDPNMLHQIAEALTKAKTEKRGRPRKGFHSQPNTEEIRIFNDDQDPPNSWKQVGAELNRSRSFPQNPDWMAPQNSGGIIKQKKIFKIAQVSTNPHMTLKTMPL